MTGTEGMESCLCHSSHMFYSGTSRNKYFANVVCHQIDALRFIMPLLLGVLKGLDCSGVYYCSKTHMHAYRQSDVTLGSYGNGTG